MRKAFAGLALVCAGACGETTLAQDDAAAKEPFALRLSIEMAAHKRLLSVMEDAGHTPAPFTTDGCSGGLSTAWDMVAELFPAFAEVHEERPPWEDCCVVHDRAYHNAGGTQGAEDSYQARITADERLRACVIETGAERMAQMMQSYDVTAAQVTTAYDLIADAMFDAVRLGGGPCSGLPWRWGYGYPSCFWPN